MSTPIPPPARAGTPTSAPDRHMTAVKFLPKSLAQIRLERGEIDGELGSQVEMPVIDRSNLDAESSPGDRAFGRAEPSHAVRHRTSPLPVNPEIYLGDKANG